MQDIFGQSLDQFWHFEFHRAALYALVQIVLIDLTLAGDNSLVIGMTAARAAPGHRKLIIFLGLLAALVLRIALALVAVRLLGFTGAKLIGGVVLLWVAGRLYTGITDDHAARKAGAEPASHVSLLHAIFLIVIADISMALDNVLAVAGIAQPFMKTDPWILFVGLALSVALMGIAASFFARLLQRFPWIGFIGVALITWVAIHMVIVGGAEVLKVAPAT